MEKNYIEFVLNGKKQRLDFQEEGIKASTSVLHYLRSKGLKAVKEVCGEGDCGACSIVIGAVESDGKMHYKTLNSCMLFLPFLDGKELITTEFLDQGTGLHPVQEALVENHAIQCGYCTSGFVMSLFSLYKEEKHIDRKKLDEALAGNLCRCTGYQSIYNAGLQLNKYDREDIVTQNEKQRISQLKTIETHPLVLESQQQKYFKPIHLKDALQFRQSHPTASIVAGGSDLALLQNKQDIEFDEILDLSGLEELKYFKENNTEVEWGALLPIEDVYSKIPFPAWHSLLERFASKQIRNIATFAGNIANASPIGDTIPLLFAFGAKLKIASLTGKREIKVEDFIQGYRQTDLKDNELITAIILPKPDKYTSIRSYKISKRKHVDISILSAAFRMQIIDETIIEAYLAFGGMAAQVKRASNVEHFLKGKTFSEAVILKASELLKKEFQPLSDARSDATYRNKVAGNLLIRFYEEIKEN
jgi:xanthine dehydrogenase small subunit